MKLKLDENLPGSARVRLAALGFDVDTVVDEGLGGKSDDDVWRAAQAEGRFFITLDLDFSDIRRFAPGTHAGLMLVRLPDDEQPRSADYVVASFSLPEARSWTGAVVVVSPAKIRVLAPPASAAASPSTAGADDDSDGDAQ